MAPTPQPRSTPAAKPRSVAKPVPKKTRRGKYQYDKVPARLEEFKEYLRVADVTDLMTVERKGVSSSIVKSVLDETGWMAVDMQRLMGVSRSTFTLKMKSKETFDGTHGQSLFALVELINMVDDMLAAKIDDPRAQQLDPLAWLGKWMKTPQPALGGREPSQFMDTPLGRQSVKRLLGSLESDSYQ